MNKEQWIMSNDIEIPNILISLFIIQKHVS